MGRPAAGRRPREIRPSPTLREPRNRLTDYGRGSRQIAMLPRESSGRRRCRGLFDVLVDFRNGDWLQLSRLLAEHHHDLPRRGLNIPARGNAPGTDAANRSSPERAVQPTLRAGLGPARGAPSGLAREGMAPVFLGHCPRLTCCGPFGAGNRHGRSEFGGVGREVSNFLSRLGHHQRRRRRGTRTSRRNRSATPISGPSPSRRVSGLQAGARRR